VRIAVFDDDGPRRSAVVVEDLLYPLPDGADPFELLTAGRQHPDWVLATCGLPLPVDAVRLLAPVEPATVRHFTAVHELRFTFGNPYSILGPADDVPVPPGSVAMGLGLEVAAVIGRAGRDLSPTEAADHIAGFTILNHWSARDVGTGAATTLGPWLVSPDELDCFRDRDGYLDLELEAYVNGERVGQGRLRRMEWTFDDMVAYASRGTEVRPGDVLGSGMCADGQPPLRPDDNVTLSVQGIGTLTSRVVPGVGAVPIPPRR